MSNRTSIVRLVLALEQQLTWNTVSALRDLTAMH